MRSRERGPPVTRNPLQGKCHEIFDLFKVAQPVSLSLAVRLKLLRISAQISKERKIEMGLQDTQGPEEDDSCSNKKSRGIVCLRGGGRGKKG